MDAYIVRFFGSLTIYKGDTSLDLPTSSIARSLLAYLIYHRNQFHTRFKLIGLFWPDLPEARGRRALSQALWQIRKCLPEGIHASISEVGILKESLISNDIDEFQLLRNSPETLQRACQVYRGEFLDGIYDDWVFPIREKLKSDYVQTLEELIQRDKTAFNYPDALKNALQLSLLAPLENSVHREVMQLYVLTGQPKVAIHYYEDVHRILREELGLEPDSATKALAAEITRQIKSADSSTPIRSENIQTSQLPLVGRNQERSQLLTCLESIFDDSARSGGMIIIEGEAGVGKTRLLQEIERDVEWRNGQVLWGSASEMTLTPPYGPLVNALDSGLSPLRADQIFQVSDPLWLQIIQPLFESFSSFFPNLAALPISQSGQDRNRLLEAFVQFIGAWTWFTPLVIILENLQWMDSDTLDLLPALIPRLEKLGCVIIATHRGEETRSFPALWEKIQRIDQAGLKRRFLLIRLTDSCTRELIRQALGMSQTAPLFETRIFLETHGNPLFILETLRALYDENLLRRSETGTWSTPWDETTTDYHELPLPQAVEQMINRRLARLSPDLIYTLQFAAVLGSEFDFATLLAGSGLENQILLNTIRELVRRHFINETSHAYQFSHDKIRQVVFAGIPKNNLQQFHLQAGQAIELIHPDRCSDLAVHYYVGQDWSRAAQFSKLAGDAAAAVYANPIAADHYTRALDAFTHFPELPDALFKFTLLSAREKVYDLIGNRSAQWDDLKAIETLLRHPPLNIPTYRADYLLREVNYYESVSDLAKAIEIVRNAVQLAESGNILQTAYKAHIQWGRILKQQGEFTEAQSHFQKAYDLASKMEACDFQADSLCEIGFIFFEQGNFDSALDCYQRALKVCVDEAETEVRAKIHSRMASLYHYLADFPAALEYAHKTLSYWQKIGYQKKVIYSLYNLALCYSDSGNHQTARSHLEKVCTLSAMIGERVIEGYGWVFLALVLEVLGEYPEAIDAYQRGLNLRREVGLDAMANDPLAGLARVKTAQGKHREAVAYADQVLNWIAENGYEGIGDPLLAYLGAYRAMLAAAEHSRGLAALQEAYSLLMKFATSISDPERRRAYIHDIDPGKSIWEDYHTYIDTDSYRRIQVRLPKEDAPTGRALQDGEWVTIQWTVATPDDDLTSGKANLRQTRLLRLVEEADAQGAAPTVYALAQALNVSARTIKRDLAILRETGHIFQTRGSREG